MHKLITLAVTAAVTLAIPDADPTLVNTYGAPITTYAGVPVVNSAGLWNHHPAFPSPHVYGGPYNPSPYGGPYNPSPYGGPYNPSPLLHSSIVPNPILRGHIPRQAGRDAKYGYVTMTMVDKTGAGSTGNHKIKIIQGGKSCTTGYLTTGPWAGETYDATICMKLDIKKCISFEVQNDSYYDPSHVRRISFHDDGREVQLTYVGGQGWMHSANIRENTACP